MKLYLASFLETENFGPGRLISITNGQHPEHVKCDLLFPSLVPKSHISDAYNKMVLKDPKNAANFFIKSFTSQLNSFYEEVISESELNHVSVFDTLPFKEGDTLASWERACYTNYRKMIFPYLARLGYEINNN